MFSIPQIEYSREERPDPAEIVDLLIFIITYNLSNIQSYIYTENSVFSERKKQFPLLSLTPTHVSLSFPLSLSPPHHPFNHSSALPDFLALALLVLGQVEFDGVSFRQFVRTTAGISLQVQKL